MNRFPPRLLLPLCALLLLLTLPSCSRKDTPAASASGSLTPPAADSADPPIASLDDLYGSWMEISQNGMKIYVFRKGGDLTLYDMESATSVRSVQSGRYLLDGDRLTLELPNSRTVHSVLTTPTSVILDGLILAPVEEPAK